MLTCIQCTQKELARIVGLNKVQCDSKNRHKPESILNNFRQGNQFDANQRRQKV